MGQGYKVTIYTCPSCLRASVPLLPTRNPPFFMHDLLIYKFVEPWAGMVDLPWKLTTSTICSMVLYLQLLPCLILPSRSIMLDKHLPPDLRPSLVFQIVQHTLLLRWFYWNGRIWSYPMHQLSMSVASVYARTCNYWTSPSQHRIPVLGINMMVATPKIRVLGVIDLYTIMITTSRVITARWLRRTLVLYTCPLKVD